MEKVSKTKKVKYLPLYYKWIEIGDIPVGKCNGNTGGLCGLFDDHELFQLLKPIHVELETSPMSGYWGCDGQEQFVSRASFNTLRQNIVLFLAAMNGEL